MLIGKSSVAENWQRADAYSHLIESVTTLTNDITTILSPLWKLLRLNYQDSLFSEYASYYLFCVSTPNSLTPSSSATSPRYLVDSKNGVILLRTGSG